MTEKVEIPAQMPQPLRVAVAFTRPVSGLEDVSGG